MIWHIVLKNSWRDSSFPLVCRLLKICVILLQILGVYMMAVCHRESALPAFRRQTSLIVSHQPSPSKMMNLKGVFITNNLSVLKLLDVIVDVRM